MVASTVKNGKDRLRKENRLRRRVNSSVLASIRHFLSSKGGEKKKKHKSGAKRCKQ